MATEIIDGGTRTLGDVLTRIAYGEHFFKHHGQEAIQKNIEGLDLLSWAAAKFWFVDVIATRTYIPWIGCRAIHA